MMEKLANADEKDRVVAMWMQMVALGMAHKAAPHPGGSLPGRVKNLER